MLGLTYGNNSSNAIRDYGWYYLVVDLLSYWGLGYLIFEGNM
jgi:hypothetical protein